MEIHQARLHDRTLVHIVNLQDFVHAAHFNHNATVEGESAPTQACASATGDKGQTKLVGQFDDGHNLLGRARENHRTGWSLVKGMPIAFVD